MEIIFGEGGDDSKLFVDELFSAYCRYAKALGFRSELLHSTFGQMSAIFTGPKAFDILAKESGKHVVQRCPETERGGRRHTSVVSVTVMPLPPDKELKPLPESELSVETLAGQGPGGQHMQKNATVVRIRHLPTGLQATGNGRDQHTNRKNALRVLTAKVNEYHHQKEQAEYNKDRKAQVKTGRGGDKVRTYNFIDSRVTDHISGKKTRNVKAVMRGEFNILD